ncbi:hypothetical protein RDI58_027072 [Solanum bulbocastanum]|uniref:Uncharacterized protein n=1 Tax=Solanum bulbocastanum TaxID=147425 RepID=A0AAN8T047_SOLBU
MVKVLHHLKSCLFSYIYASPDLNTIMNLYVELCQIALTHKIDWVIRGDFNEVLHAKEKLGGPSINNSLIDHLRNCLIKYGMVDLGYKGYKYN